MGAAEAMAQRAKPTGRAALRVVRDAVGAVSNEDAARALEIGQPVIGAAVAYYRSQSRRAFQLDPEDVESIAQIAVIEAYHSYRERNPELETTEHGGMRAWMRQVVGWRLSDALARSESEMLTLSAKEADVHPGWDVLEPTQDVDIFATEVRMWLAGALARLPVRQRIIIGGVLRGQTQAAMAAELGLSAGRVCQEYQAALDHLYLLAARAGFDSFTFGE